MNAPLIRRESFLGNQSTTRVMILVVDGVSLTSIASMMDPFCMPIRFLNALGPSEL